MNSSLKNTLTGFIIGLLSTLVFAYLFYLIRYSYISTDMLFQNPVLISPMLQIGLISNIVLIFLFSKFDKPYLLRGLGFATLVMVVVVMIIRFANLGA